jgi:catechol 2,3-dioxygenase-like lactoylglutathione lyase family enzyme
MSRAMNHVAVSVTDIKRAKEWYRDILGMKVLVEPTEIAPAKAGSDPLLGNLVKQIFGDRLGAFLICHMLTPDGTGIELFQFLDPPAARREDNFEYWKTGFFHVAITEPQVADLAEKIATSGGKKRTEVLEFGPGGKKICFCEDPFGNIIEIYSLSYEQFWGGTGLQP